MITSSDLLSKNHPTTQWIVKGILPVGLNIIAGDPKVGKSWLVLQLAKSIASGEPFLGLPVKPGVVMYYALEDSPARLAERVRLQGWKEYTHTTLFRTMDDDMDLSDGTFPLPSLIHGQFSLIIIDTLSAAFSGSQVTHSKIRELFLKLRDYAHSNRVCLSVVDHRGKSGTIFGSMAKEAFADSIWLLSETGLEITGKDTTIDHIKCYLEKGLWKVGTRHEEIDSTYKDLVQVEDGNLYKVKMGKAKRGQVFVDMQEETKWMFGTRKRNWRGRMSVKEMIGALKGRVR